MSCRKQSDQKISNKSPFDHLDLLQLTFLLRPIFELVKGLGFRACLNVAGAAREIGCYFLRSKQEDKYHKSVWPTNYITKQALLLNQSHFIRLYFPFLMQ